MLQKSKITGRFYFVESLSSEDKMKLFPDLGLNELKKELEKVPKSVKKSRVKKEKDKAE